MASSDVELEQQLKEVGKQLLHPPDSVDELLPVLDKVEKLLLRVDQSPKKSMLDALKPSMNALIHDSLSKHSDIDVKVAVASCISEITRITAPDAPYTDDQMRDVFQLIVSSFEDLADRSSRSYNKRASILETVSKVRSCVIMLDLECDELIVKMFELFLRAVRDYHLDSIFSSMENIMVLVIEESEEIPIEMLRPLLDTVKKDRVGVLPVAHKLGKGVLLKSADKLKPYMIPALTSLGESLDMYHKVVAAICEGTTANFASNDDNDSGLQPANECKLEKGSVDDAPQAEDGKLTTASSDQMDQVVKSEVCPKEEVDPTVENRSPKSLMSNGVNVMVKEEASVDQKSNEVEEDKSQVHLNKEDTDDSDADKLAKEKSQTEKISSKSEKEADTIINSVEPSDSSHVEGDKEIEKENDVKGTEIEMDNDVTELEKQNEKDNDVKESENEATIPSETERDKDAVQELSPKAVESKPSAIANVSSQSQSNSVLDESSVRSKEKPVPQEVETASPSKSGSPSDEKNVKKADVPKHKGLTQEDTPEAPKPAGKRTAVATEVTLTDTVNMSEDGEADSDSDAKPLKKPESTSKSTKKSGKKSKQSGKKLDVGGSGAKKAKQSGKNVDVEREESDSDAKPLNLSVKKGEKSKTAGKKLDVGGSDAKKPKPSGKNVDVEREESDSDAKTLNLSVKKGDKSKTAGKKLDVGGSDTKEPKQSGKNVDVERKESDSDAKTLKLSVKKGEKSKAAGKKLDVGGSDTKKPKQSGKNVDVEREESDSDAKPLNLSVKKGEKSKAAVDEGEEHDSDSKLLRLTAKKSMSKKKADGKKRGNGKNAVEKDQAKPLSGDDEMDISPKSATKSTREKSKIAVEEEEGHDSDNVPLKLHSKKSISKKKDDGKKRGSGKNVAEKDQAKSLSGDDEMDISPKSATKLATGEGNSTHNPVSNAKRKRSTGKDEVSDTIKYDGSLVGTKVKVWWPEDKMYYEGVVTEFYPAKKKHKVSYVDGDEERLNLRTQRWEILKEFSVRGDEEQNIEVQSEEVSPEKHKKKKSKPDPTASQEKIKESAKKVGGVSSSGKSKGSTPKDNKSTKKPSDMSCDAAATTSKEAAKEDEETLKTGSKTKSVNKSKGKTPTSSSKSDSNGPTKAKSNAKEPEDVKSTENTKDRSNSGRKRKKKMLM